MKILIIKLVINRVEVFKKQGLAWLEVLVEYATKENKPNGGKGFHYFLRDVVVTVIELGREWREEFVVRPNAKQKLCSVAQNLIQLSAHTNKKLFKQNMEIVDEFLGVFKDGLFVSEKTVNDMVRCDGKRENHQVWQLNGLTVLNICINREIAILQDYTEFVKNQDKFRYLNNMSLPIQFICHLGMDSKYGKEFVKQIGLLFGNLLRYSDHHKLKQLQDLYDAELYQLCTSILADTRPLETKEKFLTLLKYVSLVYSKLNNKLFLKAAEQVLHLKDKSMLFDLFTSLVNHTNVYDIIMTLHSYLDKAIYEHKPAVHLSFLALNLILANDSYIALSTAHDNYLLSYFGRFISVVDSYYRNHNTYEIALQYHQLLTKLSYIQPALTHDSLLLQFTSPYTQLRKQTFQFYSNSLAITDIYHPDHEHLFLTLAVPILLLSAQKSSDYDRYIYDQPLDANAHHYDHEFRSKAYFQKANLTLQNFTASQTLHHSLLTQALGIRATQ